MPGFTYAPNVGEAVRVLYGTGINDDAAGLWELADAWDTWTPTRTGITVGNGTETAKFFDIHGRVHFSYSLLFGSTTAFTSGVALEDWGTSAGVTPPTSYPAYVHALAACYDSSADRWFKAAGWGTSASEKLSFHYEGANVNGSVPYAWGTGDVFTAIWDRRSAPNTPPLMRG